MNRKQLIYMTILALVIVAIVGLGLVFGKKISLEGFETTIAETTTTIPTTTIAETTTTIPTTTIAETTTTIPTTTIAETTTTIPTTTIAETTTTIPTTTGPMTTGPMTTGPMTTGPMTTGPMTTGPMTTGPNAIAASNSHLAPATNIMLRNFDGTSNVFAPYLYYKQEKFKASNNDDYGKYAAY